MQAGRLRHRVTFQRAERVTLPSGQRESQWLPVVVTGGSQTRQRQGTADRRSRNVRNHCRVWMRYRPDIHPACRMVYRGQVYDIQAVIPDVKFTRWNCCVNRGERWLIWGWIYPVLLNCPVIWNYSAGLKIPVCCGKRRKRQRICCGMRSGRVHPQNRQVSA